MTDLKKPYLFPLAFDNNPVWIIACLIVIIPACGTLGKGTGFQKSTTDVSLIVAARVGNKEKAREFVAAGANVNAKDRKSGATPLIWAIGGGHLSTARLLLESGADVDASDAWGSTALSVAARNGIPEGSKILLAAGADPDSTDRFGRTPLISASTYQGSAEISQLLLENGASVNLMDQRGWDALTLAVETGRTDTVKVLLKAGANVNRADHKEFYPLSFAAKRGNLDIVRLLLAAGADINAQATYGTTALIWGVYYNHGEIAGLLLKSGAISNLRSKREEILNRWAASPDDMEALKENGVTALLLAEQSQNTALIEMLKGADALE